MKIKSLLLPIFGGLILAVSALSMIFSGAEVSGEESRRYQGYYALERIVENLGFTIGGTRFECQEENAFYFIQEGPFLTQEQWNKTASWLKSHNSILLISGLPADIDFFSDWESSAQSGRILLDAGDDEADTLQNEEEEYLALPVNPSWTPLLVLDDQYALAFERSLGKGTVLLVSDPELLRNYRLLMNDHALLIARILSPLSDRTLFYLKDASARPYQGMQFLLKGKAGLVFLQVLLLILVWLWFLFLRVRSPDLHRGKTRRELKEQLVAVGRLYSRAGYWDFLNRLDLNFFLWKMRKSMVHSRREKLRESLLEYVSTEAVDQSFIDVDDLESLKRVVKSRIYIEKTVQGKQKGASSGH